MSALGKMSALGGGVGVSLGGTGVSPGGGGGVSSGRWAGCGSWRQACELSRHTSHAAGDGGCLELGTISEVEEVVSQKQQPVWGPTLPPASVVSAR